MAESDFGFSPVGEGDEVRGKIYCANCMHCKLVRDAAGSGGQYQLRVRCDAGKVA
jgi:hypothetical protein